CARSSNEGWAPMATPCAWHSSTAVRMLASSPAWPPQAMLAELMQATMAASSPQPSPRSQLKSMRSGTGGGPRGDGHGDSMQALLLAARRLPGLGAGAGRKPQLGAGPQLRQQRPVGADHVADPWIAAVGLGIGQQHDGLAIGWQLHRAGQHGFGDALVRVGR